MLFCNIDFNQYNKKNLFEHTLDNKSKLIITANAAFIVEANNSGRFLKILNNNYVTFDGRIPYLCAKILCSLSLIPHVSFEKLSGSDIIYDFCEFAKENNYKVFFLGGQKEANQKAVDTIKKQYSIAISGYSPDFEDYPFSDNFNNSCLNAIKQFKPGILFVGFGAPKQEYWADDNIESLSKIRVKYIIGCGGTFDFIAKKNKRAPVFIQKIGFEGIYRFFQEPNILRYRRLIDSFKFFKYIWCKPDIK
jgi:N-acetylglucosaminyldiphosphoundecaprenol N-acetyl-beta-D-mannosaminyltransferase